MKAGVPAKGLSQTDVSFCVSGGARAPFEGGGCAERLCQWILLMRKGKMGR